MKFNFYLRLFRPFLGVFDVKIDRGRQIITFHNKGQVETLTVDQLFDEIERMFNKIPIMADDGCKALEAPQTSDSLRSWLTECDKPLTDPQKYPDQALTEPGRPLAAPSA